MSPRPPSASVQRHLGVLEEAGLVRGYRAGREPVRELEPDRFGEARRPLDFISERWDAPLARLKRMVED